jgi:hypothetical protein
LEEEQRRKQIWYSENIDESEVLREMRERTREIIDESK